jgi:hypothetical protein
MRKHLSPNPGQLEIEPSSMPQPLPVDLPETFNVSDEIADIRSAYSRVLLLEQAAHSSTDRETREQKLVRAGSRAISSWRGLRCRRANS